VIKILKPLAGVVADNISKIPITAWLAAFLKALYDRELAITERAVKPADIIHNSSHILGKQIIHILPEGFVFHLLPVVRGRLIKSAVPP